MRRGRDDVDGSSVVKLEALVLDRSITVEREDARRGQAEPSGIPAGGLSGSLLVPEPCIQPGVGEFRCLHSRSHSSVKNLEGNLKRDVISVRDVSFPLSVIGDCL